jgi:uncharacterized protein (UPF0276 family)
MIERDDNIPPLAELLVELDRARRLAEDAARQGGQPAPDRGVSPARA